MLKIALDGPSGAGKSTIAKMLAKRLGILYVDTGALYRTIGYSVRKSGIDPKDKQSVIAKLPEIRIDLRYEDGVQKVFLNEEEMGDKIRTPEISMYASAVSAIPEVRTFLLETQRNLANKYNVIMDGRDIGTVILPDANVKVFMFASNECRAKRRYEELKAKGMDVRYEDILKDMTERDLADRTRAVAPCVPAPDALPFDNSDYNPEECVEYLCRVVFEKTGFPAEKPC